MKLRTNQFKNTSDFQGETGSATLNMAKLSLFMENMIKNYNYPELAVLREWVSNAHDSHVASGVDSKIKVTLPSQLNPTLIVQDFGAGMSHEFVTDSYLCIGTSSKDESDDEIGGFGQGAKSALAIASQYTMTTIHNGLKSVFIFERSPMGGIDYKAPIVRVPTDEPNGVTVQVAVDRIDQYSEVNINRVLAGWSNSAIELNTGKEFFSIPDNSEEVTYEVEVSDAQGNIELVQEKGYVLSGAFDTAGNSSKMSSNLKLNWREYVVLVGPVAYIFEPEVNSRRVLNEYMVPSVSIGRVSFPSSREVIESTRANRSYIGKCIEKVAVEADRILQERANELSTPREALKLHNSPLAKNRNDFSVKFKGEVVPVRFTPQVDDEVFAYEHVGSWRGVKNFKLVEQTFHADSQFSLDIETLIVADDPKATLQSIRNNVRLFHASKEHKPGDLKGYLVITKTPSSWLKAAARVEMKVSELAELARVHRKKIRDEAAAAKASGVTAPSAKKTRLDRIGEYSSHWLDFTTDENGVLKVVTATGELSEFVNSVLDKNKTLAISQRSSDKFAPNRFTNYFAKLNVNPSDVQFLHVDTTAKLETLRLLLGSEEELNIVDFDSWMKSSFAKNVKLTGKTPQELAQDLPFSPDANCVNLLEHVGLATIHPKYTEIVECHKKLETFNREIMPRYYDNVSPYLRSILGNFFDYKIEERPEFFFLSNMSWYGRGLNSKQKEVIRESLNNMIQTWLDNLALEEAEALENEAADMSAVNSKDEALVSASN